MITPRPTNDGMEWKDVTGDDAGIAHFERPGPRALAEARGDFETCEIRGTLFEARETYEVLGVIRSGGIVELLYSTTRMWPVVTGGTATVRLYVPKG